MGDGDYLEYERDGIMRIAFLDLKHLAYKKELF